MIWGWTPSGSLVSVSTVHLDEAASSVRTALYAELNYSRSREVRYGNSNMGRRREIIPSDNIDELERQEERSARLDKRPYTQSKQSHNGNCNCDSIHKWNSHLSRHDASVLQEQQLTAGRSRGAPWVCRGARGRRPWVAGRGWW